MSKFIDDLTRLQKKKRLEYEQDLAYIASVQLNARKEEARFAEKEKSMKFQANTQMQASMLRDGSVLEKERSALEDDIKELGIVINQHSSLKPEDQTEDGKNILDFTYQTKSNEIDWNKIANANMAERFQIIDNRNQKLKSEISELQERKRQFEFWDDEIAEKSKDLFEMEWAQGVGKANWRIDEREMAKFIGANKEDYNLMVAEFGGGKKGEAEVKKRLRKHFSQYAPEQLKVLNAVVSVKGQELNLAKRQMEMGLVPATAQFTLESELKDLDNMYKEMAGVLTQMGVNYTDDQIEKEPIFYHLQGETIEDRSGKAGIEAQMKLNEIRMEGFIKAIDDNEGILGTDTIPSELRNDKRTLALWYTGQIAKMDDSKFFEKYPEYKDIGAEYTSKNGTKYVYIDNDTIQFDYADKRLQNLELNKDQWGADNKADLVFGSVAFLREYSMAHKLYEEIEKKEAMIEQGFGVKANPSFPVKSSLIANDSKRDDLSAAETLLQAEEQFGMSQDRIREEADRAGLPILNWIEKETLKRNNSMAHLTPERAKEIYYESGFEGDGIPEEENAYDIVQQLESIDKEIEKSFTDYLNDSSDGTTKRDKMFRWDNEGYYGPKYEMLNERASYLLDELNEIKDLSRKAGGATGLWESYEEKYKPQFKSRTQFRKALEDIGALDIDITNDDWRNYLPIYEDDSLALPTNIKD